FYGNGHAGGQPHAASFCAVIGNTWIFMELRTYSVADEFSYHRVTASFDILLDRTAAIAEASSRNRMSDSDKQSLSGSDHQFLCLHADLSTGKGPCVVAVEALIKSADVKADNVAPFEDLFLGRYAMDHHIVH